MAFLRREDTAPLQELQIQNLNYQETRIRLEIHIHLWRQGKRNKIRKEAYRFFFLAAFLFPAFLAFFFLAAMIVTSVSLRRVDEHENFQEKENLAINSESCLQISSHNQKIQIIF